MMIATLQTMGGLSPDLSVRGDVVKIDLGALVIEMDKGEFVRTIKLLLNGAAEYEIYFWPLI